MKLYEKNTGSHLIEVSETKSFGGVFVAIRNSKTKRTSCTLIRPAFSGGCMVSINGNDFIHCPEASDAGIRIFLMLSSFRLREKTLSDCVSEIDKIIENMFFYYY